ncbi:hypothetical protein P9761_11635 [Brevibacillus centrosporus]|uniref:phage/plasmid replication domain-containing protein n=1 Tax=Brevibacillus centrosporus TaxID=54910 RepID=UPI002E211EEE|nr:phage/plasmid replication protein [Brevibacillus centrosporus]MED4908868.1 hypothetical protein [Brevibacillus centrosporus]
MFDTVRLQTIVNSLNLIDCQDIENLKEFTYVNQKTGELCTKITGKTSKLPFIQYNSCSGRLEVELSIPKLLYGENVTLLNQDDIQTFFALLEDELYRIFGKRIEKETWQVKRLDVCWNFAVGDKVKDYLKQIALMKINRLIKVVYQDGESVVFHDKNNQKRIMFYDKERECIQRKCQSDLIERANGLLRLEIRLPLREITNYAKERRAVDILRKGYFIYATAKILPIEFTSSNEISYEWVTTHGINKAEMTIGFQTLKNEFGENGIKSLYSSSTLHNRKKLIKEMEQDVLVPELLFIDYSSL